MKPSKTRAFLLAFPGIGEHDCPVASMLFGLLPEFPFASGMTQDLRKSRSSPLNHIFSTIPPICHLQLRTGFAAAPVAHEWLPQKYTFALRAPFPNSQVSEFRSWTTRVPQKSGNSDLLPIAVRRFRFPCLLFGSSSNCCSSSGSNGVSG